MSEFFHMGGYAFYVWSSYALTALVMIIIGVAAVKAHSREKKRIQRMIRRKENQS